MDQQARRAERKRRKHLRRRHRKATGKTTRGTVRRLQKEAVRAADAMRMNDELLAQRTSQAKESDRRHNRAREALAAGVHVRKKRWHPGTPNKRMPRGYTGVGTGRPVR